MAPSIAIAWCKYSEYSPFFYYKVNTVFKLEQYCHGLQPWNDPLESSNTTLLHKYKSKAKYLNFSAFCGKNCLVYLNNISVFVCLVFNLFFKVRGWGCNGLDFLPRLKSFSVPWGGTGERLWTKSSFKGLFLNDVTQIKILLGLHR